MTLLVNRYDGYYRFANLLERLAQAIQDGVIEQLFLTSEKWFIRVFRENGRLSDNSTKFTQE